MKQTKMIIKNSKGITLNAVLDLPPNKKPYYFAIFAHCFTCNSNFNAVRHISKALTNHGFGVVRFDFTGLGSSEGSFSESHFSANVQDLIDVNNYITENYKAPSLMVGHSLGGAAVLVASSKLDNIKAVTTIGAPSHINHIKKHFSEAESLIKDKSELQVNIGGRPFLINKDFLDDFEKLNLLDIVNKLRKPLLIMHSPVDTIVGIQNAQDLYENAHHPKSFISLDQADHLLSASADGHYVGDMIGTWVKRYFTPVENKMLETNDEQLVAYLNLKEDKFSTYIQTKTHSFISDEPEHVGGDDLGPSPYDYLSAALAACTTMTLKLYADRKNWELDEIYVYITHSKKHIEDIQDQSGKGKFLSHISKKLEFKGNLTHEQKKRLEEIASRCPVHKSLKENIIIETSTIN
jgi:putative redox protein